MKYQVVNPTTGQVEQEYPTATDAEIGEILDRAGRGYPAWRRTAMTERADILRRVARLYQDRSVELSAIVTREMGKTTAEAQGELEFTVSIYHYYADHAADLLKDEPLHSNTPGTAWVRKSPSSCPNSPPRCPAIPPATPPTRPQPTGRCRRSGRPAT